MAFSFLSSFFFFFFRKFQVKGNLSFTQLVVVENGLGKGGVGKEFKKWREKKLLLKQWSNSGEVHLEWRKGGPLWCVSVKAPHHTYWSSVRLFRERLAGPWRGKLKQGSPWREGVCGWLRIRLHVELRTGQEAWLGAGYLQEQHRKPELCPGASSVEKQNTRTS